MDWNYEVFAAQLDKASSFEAKVELINSIPDGMLRKMEIVGLAEEFGLASTKGGNAVDVEATHKWAVSVGLNVQGTALDPNW